MKKTLSVLALLGIVSMACIQSANAFSWSNLNPFRWGKCNKCEKKVDNCPCPAGYAAPCDPCEQNIPSPPCGKQITKPVPCDACDRLQQEMAK
jgi:hypothetical protein